MQLGEDSAASQGIKVIIRSPLWTETASTRAAQRGDRVERVGAGAPRSPAVGFWACYSARPIFFGRPAISLASPYRRYNVYCTGPPNPLARFTGKLRPRRHTPTILGGAFAGRATGHCRPLIRRQSRDIGALHLDEAVRSWMCTDEHQNKSLREMWWKIGSCLPSSSGSALLPQSLQGELSRACGPRPCPRQEVVRLPSSLDVNQGEDQAGRDWLIKSKRRGPSLSSNRQRYDRECKSSEERAHAEKHQDVVHSGHDAPPC